MPDISMCDREECPVKRICYRFMAIPDPLQTYGSFSPTSEKGCDDFEPLMEGDKIRD